MVSISERLDGELREALKSRDDIKLSVIRLLKASLKNKEIEKGGKLTDDEVLSVLSTFAKQRRESIDHFTSAGRLDLAEREEKELDIVHSYLPKQLSLQELDAIILSAIKECDASSPAAMGKVMKLVMPRVKGVADGQVINQRVKEILSSHS